MEFRRATLDEPVDEWLVARHVREIVPLLHRRGDFAEAKDFLLYDFGHDAGGTDENVFAYSNGWGASRSLVIYHNRFGDTSGWIRSSTSYAVKDDDGGKHLATRTLAEGLGIAEGDAAGRWVAYREQRSSLEYLRSVADIRDQGLHVTLQAYETRILWQVRELQDTSGIWGRLAERLGGRGVPSLEDALRDLQLLPVHDAIRAAIESPSRETAARVVDAVAEATGTGQGDAARKTVVDAIVARAASTELVAKGIADRSQAAALRVSALLAPLGSLPKGAPVGPTSRAWYDELRLAPVVAEGLRRRGLDEGAAWWAAERVRLLLDLPLPSSVRGAPERVPFRLMTAWLEHPAAAPFLRVNLWDGVAWFHGESLDELLAWAQRLELVADPLALPSPALAEIAAASAASAFRVDALRDALRVPGEEADPEAVEPVGTAAGPEALVTGAVPEAEAIEPEADAVPEAEAGSPSTGKPPKDKSARKAAKAEKKKAKDKPRK
jgi:hypothetical protein